MHTILVADDEKSMTEFLEIMLTREGYEVITTATAEGAIEQLEKGGIDLTITDINMPTAGGMAVMERAHTLDTELPVIMITAYASTENAVSAMKLGAYDYITKPFQVDEIKLTIAKALERRTDKAEIKRLKEEVTERYSFGGILGRSEKMLDLFRLIQKVADSRSSVLISGESGVGKEMVAKAIHFLSPNKNGPFYSINCGAMPEQLLESELFGHQKGSFTGAHADKRGLLELSDGGAFFLDEVGEAPLSIQVKLLRFLQEREFRRVGGVKDIKVSLRVIAATNRNLEEMIAKGEFREDLYYRLNIINLEIPPLRERRVDIPLLAARFLEQFATANNRVITSISSDAMKLLENHGWRGNVRELENVIERAVVLTSGPVIEIDSLPEEIKISSPDLENEEISIPNGGIDLDAKVEELEKDLLLKALSKTKGIKKEAAKILNLSFRSFRYKLSKHGIGGRTKEGGEQGDE